MAEYKPSDIEIQEQIRNIATLVGVQEAQTIADRGLPGEGGRFAEVEARYRNADIIAQWVKLISLATGFDTTSAAKVYEILIAQEKG